MLKPVQSRAFTAFLFLLIFISASCKTLDPFYKNKEELDLNIKAYNLDFENKSIDRSARLVHPEHRAQYLAKSLEVTKRITIFEASTLGIKFFNNGVPTLSIPDKDFDRAIVIIRYQLAVLPSTKLTSLIFEQEWVLYKNKWFTIPDLSAFLE